jgi:hypothetical protein
MSKRISPSKTKSYIKARKELLNWVSENSTLVINYPRWYSGITKNPKARKSSHNSNPKNPSGAYLWYAVNVRSVKIALALETSLHKLGFLDTDDKGGYDKEKSKWVYVFKRRPTIID